MVLEILECVLQLLSHCVALLLAIFPPVLEMILRCSVLKVKLIVATQRNIIHRFY